MAYLKYVNDERLNIARGLVRDTTFVHKFGAVQEMSVAATGTIWDVDDTLYPWSAFNTPGVLNIPAVDADDNGNIITVVGLDSNYNEISEDFTVSNTGTTTGLKTFARVFRAFDTTGTNVENINIRRDTTVVARLTAGKGQTLMAVYTVPAGYTGYLMQGTASIEAGGDATGDMFVRYFGQTSFRVGHTFEVEGQGGQYFYPFAVPIPIPEKSDIDIRATMRSNNSRMTAAFDLILIKNDGVGLRE
jgi:hypothetical protein